MINVSEEARDHLDRYLRRVRGYLKAYPQVDADEVEQNIRDHIANEIQPSGEVVSAEVLDRVLQRLGSPDQWTPPEGLSWWRNVAVRLRYGPEDWRLAYLSFGLLILGLLAYPLTGLPGAAVLVAASALAARGILSVESSSSVPRAQKWLIYPSLAPVYLVLLLGLLAWPGALLAVVAGHYEHAEDGALPWSARNEGVYWAIWVLLIAAATCLWGVVLSWIAQRKKRLFQWAFYPFAQDIPRRGVIWGRGLALFLAVVCLGAAILLIITAA